MQVPVRELDRTLQLASAHAAFFPELPDTSAKEIARSPPQALERMTLGVAASETDKNELTAWMQEVTRK